MGRKKGKERENGKRNGKKVKKTIQNRVKGRLYIKEWEGIGMGNNRYGKRGKGRR